MAIGPLSGVRVLEYCGFIAGPHCGKMLADMGAEVIKIEPPEGDEARRHGPYLADEVNPECSGVFLYENTNKKGITLNLESTKGQEIFKELVKTADVLIEDTKAGTMERMGLDYQVLKQINPGLIMTSITPFGQYGPYRDYKAYNLNIYHASGAGYVLPAASPNAEREPIKGGGYVGETDIGACASIAILGALFWRNAGGTGQYIDISRQEAEMALERMNIVRYYMLGKDPSRVGVNRVRDTLLQCKDGGYVIVVLYPQKQWDGLVRALGDPGWATEDRFVEQKIRDQHFNELKELLRREAKKYDTMELFAKIQAEGTACAPVCSAEQTINSPQTLARNFFVEMEHPVAGKLKYAGLPYQMSKTAPKENHAAPLLGQDNAQVLCMRLGYSKQDVVKLREAGII
jgi:crotonobetainyl-CoA:carnitine CoA-transferase CaiB-like acyl-CoA transferase